MMEVTFTGKSQASVILALNTMHERACRNVNGNLPSAFLDVFVWLSRGTDTSKSRWVITSSGTV
ncbi:MAG: hypothetical protein V8R91_19235 [Butyricimonas faecihominis]